MTRKSGLSGASTASSAVGAWNIGSASSAEVWTLAATTSAVSEVRSLATASSSSASIAALLALLHPLAPGFLPELIRSAATTHALGQFWRVMSDLFIDLAVAERDGRVRSIPDVVEFIKQGLVAAAGNPITYGVQIAGEQHWILPPEAGLSFLVDVAVPYVEAVFLRGMPFLGTVSFNAQAQQISPDQAQFTYGALYADPLPSMGAGIPPSLLMQDMYRHLPEPLHQWYRQRTRGEGDVRVKICMSFQKAMFCVTNAAINGTMPHALNTTAPAEQAAKPQTVHNYDPCLDYPEYCSEKHHS